MSENKEFPIPFDESRRGKRAGHEEKSIGRRLLGRAIDRPSIGRNRGRNNNVDLPTGGKPGKRRPTGTTRDIDGDGWVDEGTTNPRWMGVPSGNGNSPGVPNRNRKNPNVKPNAPKSSREIESIFLSSGKLRERPVVEEIDRNLKDGSLSTSPNKGIIGMRDGGFSVAKKPSESDSFLRQEYREWSIGDEKVIFGIPERPASMADDPGYYDGDAKIVPMNPYVISGLPADSKEGQEIAKKWAYAKSSAEVAGDEEPTYIEALLYAGSRGDSEAMSIFDEFAKVGKAAADKAKEERAATYLQSYNREDVQQDLKRAGLDNLSIDDLYLVHETKYEPEFDEDGNLMLRPLGDWVLKNLDGQDATYDRETIHFAMNHLAGGHLMRQRNDEGENRYIIVSKLSDVLEMNPGSIDALNPVDVGLVPPPNEPLRLPKKSIKVLENPDTEDVDSLVSQTLREMGAKHIFTAGEYGNKTETSAILKIASELGANVELHANTPSGSIEQIDKGTNLSGSFIGANWLGEMSENSIARLGNNSKWHGLKETGYSMRRDEYEDLLNSNSGKLGSDTGRSEVLFSGKAPQYPRPPAYGPLIGGAEEYFDGVKDWQEFAEKYRGRDVVWIDYETTGLVFDEFGKSSANGKPVQLGAVKVRDGKIVDRFNVFINPGEPLGEWSRQYLRGPGGENLTDEWLSTQMSLSDAHRQFAEFAGAGAILGLQNAAFDKNVLEDELKENGIDWQPTGYIDTMDMSAMTLPKWTPENQDGPSMVGRDGERRASSSLKAITEYLDVELGDKHHTADADAEAAAMVMENLIARAIENGWTADAIKPDTRREFVEKRKKEFDEKVAKFEEDKKSYLDALANESDGDKLSSGATKTKARKYGDSKPGGEERFIRNSSTWLKGLSSKQIAELVVPESHEQYIEMLLDDYFPARDGENPGFVDAFKNNLIESMKRSPWIKGDYSEESTEKIRELVESSLEASPSLKWAFENFGAPMFVMLTPEGASLYENQPALKAKREQIMQSRGLKSEPFVRGIQFTGKDLISFNRKLIVDQMSNDPDFETSPLIADANHVVRPGRANIDIAASSTLSHEYGHWLQKRALRENERTAKSVTGVKYGGEQVPSSRMPLVIRIAEMYENAEVDELIGKAHRDGMPLEATPSIPRTVTTYAHTNGREMIAEGFSAFFHPNPDVKNQAINKKLLDDVYRMLGLEPGEAPWSA